jgi:chorismate mutase
MDINEIREKIDLIDQEILSLLVKRFSVLPEVVKYKRENNLSIQDRDRELRILKDKIERALSLGMNPDFVEDLFESIFKESRRIQNDIKK